VPAIFVRREPRPAIDLKKTGSFCRPWHPQERRSLFTMGSLSRKMARGQSKQGGIGGTKVIVYSTPTCSWCDRLKGYLRDHNVSFRDVDVSRDRKGAAQMQRLTRQMAVPVLQVGKRAIVGFKKDEVDALLGIG